MKNDGLIAEKVMQRLHQLVVLALACLMAALGGAPLYAQEAGLKRLDTGDDGRGWEAVGRLELPGKGFCTGALIAPDLVLTAAHCLFDKAGARLEHDELEFLAGWRNGRATAYRRLRRAVVHPGYSPNGEGAARRVRNDLALLELRHPIRNMRVVPFDIAKSPEVGQRVGVVSYAFERPDAPSLQEECAVIARQEGVLVMSCDVDYGSSGAPVFSFDGDTVRIVSVVSAKAEADGQKVSLGTQLEAPLKVLRAELVRGEGHDMRGPASDSRPGMSPLGERRDTGAKFARP